MDNQHLGRNSSSWFPPSVSEGYKMGPCEQEGGSERRVCVRARTGRREAVLLAQDTQPRGNGSEGIIKSGKRGWELRGPLMLCTGSFPNTGRTGTVPLRGQALAIPQLWPL